MGGAAGFLDFAGAAFLEGALLVALPPVKLSGTVILCGSTVARCLFVHGAAGAPRSVAPARSVALAAAVKTLIKSAPEEISCGRGRMAVPSRT